MNIETFPQPPKNSVFSLVKVETVTLPHPYCITPRHVAWASDHCGGMLTHEAIKEAEAHGAVCDICRARGNILSIDQHESSITLFIRVPNNQDLNAVPGLHTYLFANKQAFINAGIQGFAFPH